MAGLSICFLFSLLLYKFETSAAVNVTTLTAQLTASTITNLGYPGYRGNSEHVWVIVGKPLKHNVKICFNAFNIGSNDFLKICNGDYNHTALGCKNWTGSNWPENRRSVGNALFIYLKTNSDSQSGGVSLTYRAILVSTTNDSCPEVPQSNIQTTFTPVSSTYGSSTSSFNQSAVYPGTINPLPYSPVASQNLTNLVAVNPLPYNYQYSNLPRNTTYPYPVPYSSYQYSSPPPIQNIMYPTVNPLPYYYQYSSPPPNVYPYNYPGPYNYQYSSPAPYQNWQTYNNYTTSSPFYSTLYNPQQNSGGVLNALDQFQTLHSLGYPTYQYSSSTSWNLQTEVGKVIQLCFDDFNMSPGSGFVIVCGGSRHCSNGLDSTCQMFSAGGYSIPHVNVSISNSISVCYLSMGGAQGDRGFSLRYRSLNQSSISNSEPSCPSQSLSSSIPPYQYPTQQPYYPYSSQQSYYPYNSQESIGGPLNAVDQFQILQSPGYPGFQPINLISWTIQTEVGKHIQLCFDDFSMYSGSGGVIICSGSIYCTALTSIDHSICQMFPASNIVPNVNLSLSNNITVCYQNLGGAGYRGFSARYRSVNQSSVSNNETSCPSPPPTPSIPPYQYVTQQPYYPYNYPYNTQQSYIPNQVLNASDNFQMLKNPGYPTYQNYMNVRWTIEAQPEHVIQICFNDFYMETNYDSIAICDGANVTCSGYLYYSSNLPASCQRYTGSKIPRPTVSLSNNVTVCFTTDGSVTWRGFNSTYRAIPVSSAFNASCPDSQTTSPYQTSNPDPYYSSYYPSTPAPSQPYSRSETLNATNNTQILNSQGYPGNYQNLMSVRSVIEAAPGNLIQICFTDFNLEQSFDYVSICEGANVTCENPNVLARYCKRYTGTTVPLPNRFVSQSNQITVCFTSDSTITQRGYSAVYKAIGHSNSNESCPYSSSSPYYSGSGYNPAPSYPSNSGYNNPPSYSSSNSMYSSLAMFYPEGMPSYGFDNTINSVRLATNIPSQLYSSYFSFVPPLYPFGLVQIYSGSWSYICGTNWTVSTAAVVCRMLGYQSNVTIAFKISRQTAASYSMNSYTCAGDETSLANCTISTVGGQNCNTLAAAVCGGSL